jgi:phosphoesterase RecJ-like protein
MNLESSITLQEIFSLLSSFRTWIILTHQKPDGDAVGAASSLAVYGMEHGKNIRWGGVDPLPTTYSFLPLADQYEIFPHINELLPFPEKTAVISLDTSNLERSVPGLEIVQGKHPIFNIDHHGDNTRYGDYNYIDESASSLGEILWHMFHLTNAQYDYNTAMGLYTAIITDSGKFSFSSTSPRTHQAAAELLQKGVSPSDLNHKIFYSQPVESVHLWGKAFARVQLIVDDRASLSWLSLQDFSQLGSSPADTEGLVNELLRVKGAEFAVLLVEEQDQVRVSLRSRGDISAREIAQQFGGGGHIQAAGCHIEAALTEAIAIITESVKEAMQ